ncbi:MAG: purple acid phosphatase family protein [Gammaproteobacteria bacterium]
MNRIAVRSSQLSQHLLLLIFLLLVLPAVSIAQTVIRGPYLQSPTPNSIIVKWRTDIATDSAVGYNVLNGTPQSTTDATSTTEHEVTISSLSADTLYNYTVGTTGGVLAGGDLNTNGDGEHFFTTSPATGTEKDTRIWVIGDSGTADINAETVREGYKTFTGLRGTDVWLMLGDNAYNIGSDTEYQSAVFEIYPQLLRQIPLWSAVGNHDGIDIAFNPPGAYPQIFEFPAAGEAGGVASGSEFYYSFDYGSIHFISLDSTLVANASIGSAMMTWLANDLAANTQDWTIAFWHHPEYSKGSHDSDVEAPLIFIRENVVPVLEAHGVDLMLSGHSHSYERSYLLNGHHGQSGTLVPAMILDGGDGSESGDGAYLKPGPAGTPNEGAVHVVVGSSGKIEVEGDLDHPAMHVSMFELGSLVVDVSGNRLDGTFIDETGAIQDEFTIIKSPPMVVNIDVQPWDADNAVLPASSEIIGVAIQGMSTGSGDPIDFDASQVDIATVTFAIGEAPNVAVPWMMDFDGDTLEDLLLGFQTMDTGIVCNDTDVEVFGETFGGEEFTGTDSIATLDCIDEGCHP